MLSNDPIYHRPIPRGGFALDDMPLDAARAAFGWLLTGPRPLSLEGRGFAGLPDREMPLDEVRHHLLRRRCPQPVRDAVWAHLVGRSREQGGSWTVGCVGVALPALTGIAARLTARFAGDPRDVHAALLSGFLAELATVDLTRPWIMPRLRWAAYRGGHTCLRESLAAPTPSARAFHSSVPPPPCGHPDLVLVRAIAAGVLTAAEAELIGSTRLEDISLAEAAARRGSSYEATKKARQRAERRLVGHLRDQLEDTDDEAGEPEHLTEHTGSSRTVIVQRLSPTHRRHVRRRMSPDAPHDGVQVRGRDHHRHAAPTPPVSRTKPTGDRSGAAPNPSASQARPDEQLETPRCA